MLTMSSVLAALQIDKNKTPGVAYGEVFVKMTSLLKFGNKND